MEESHFLEAAELYRSAWRRRLTVRSSTDCLIAACALRHDMAVRHRDRDYGLLAEGSPLRVVRARALTGVGYRRQPLTASIIATTFSGGTSACTVWEGAAMKPRRSAWKVSRQRRVSRATTSGAARVRRSWISIPP